MAKYPEDSRSKDSKLQSLLSSLTNEEIEEMYHSKIKLALDRSMTSTYRLRSLEEEINILAAEMKARNMDMRSRSPSRKTKFLPSGSGNEKFKTAMEFEKERRQRIGNTEAKEGKSPEPKSGGSKRKSDSATNTSTNSAERKRGNNNILQEKKKVTFNEKKTNLKLQPPDYDTIIEHRNELPSQITPGEPRKENNELELNQTDFNKIQETDITRAQPHHSEPKREEEPTKNEDLVFDDGDEEENLFTLVVGTAGRFKIIETLYQNTILEYESDFALVDRSPEATNNPKKPVKNADRATRSSGRNGNSNIDRRRRKADDPVTEKDEEEEDDDEPSELLPRQRKQ